jgi:protease I
MAKELTGKRVAFLIANEGAEQVELTSPWEAVQQAGGQPVLVAPESGKAQAFNHLDKGRTFDIDVTVASARVEDFDALVLPGGVASPDRLRTDQAAVRLVRDFFDSGRPVAVICHGPWTIVEADRARGRTLTSWPSVKTDIRNAGGNWVDEEVHVCTAGPSTLVSSRSPDDLKAFNEALVEVFASAGTGGPRH